MFSLDSERWNIKTHTMLCWLRFALVHGVATGGTTVAIDWIPDITAGGASHQGLYSSSSLQTDVLLTSKRQLCHRGSSLSPACPGHCSTCWFWPLPCIWQKCSPLSHQSCTASLVLLLASSKRTHQQLLSRRLKGSDILCHCYRLRINTEILYTDRLRGRRNGRKYCKLCTKNTDVFDLPSGFSKDFLYSAR